MLFGRVFKFNLSSYFVIPPWGASCELSLGGSWGSGHTEHIHSCRPGFLQQARNFPGGMSGGDDIVDQQQVPILKVSLHLKASAQVLGPLPSG